MSLLSSDWLQLGWLHLFYMPTSPTAGPTLIRLVTTGLAALILHAYRSYWWAYSHQTGYTWVGRSYSTCLQVLQVGLLSSGWLQLGWLHLFYMHTGPTGGPTLIRLVTIGLVALILHAYRSYRWVYSHQTGYNWVGCTYSTCLQVLQVAYSHQTGYNWVGCTYSACLQVLQVGLLSLDW